MANLLQTTGQVNNSEDVADDRRGVMLKFPNHLEKGVFYHRRRDEPAALLKFPLKELALARIKRPVPLWVRVNAQKRRVEARIQRAKETPLAKRLAAKKHQAKLLKARIRRSIPRSRT
jgi:hypothetical protein